MGLKAQSLDVFSLYSVFTYDLSTGQGHTDVQYSAVEKVRDGAAVHSVLAQPHLCKPLQKHNARRYARLQNGDGT